MSLIKWKPPLVQYLTKRNPEMIDRVFDVRPNQPARTYNPEPVRVFPEVPVIRDHIELLRVCSSRRMPYMSRYKIDGRQLIYACSVPLDDLARHTQYDGRLHESVQVHNSQFGYEKCPWCSTSELGVLHCGVCDSYMCFGLVYPRGADKYIVCVGCNVEGKVVNNHSCVQTGIFPKVSPR